MFVSNDEDAECGRTELSPEERPVPLTIRVLII